MSFFRAQRQNLAKLKLKLIIAVIATFIATQASVFAAQTEYKTSGSASQKAKVIEFYASWCEPCKRLQPAMEHARREYGDDLEFVRVNVDDPRNREAIEQYGVCPIPTVIFLDKKENVKAYAVGTSDERNIEAGIRKILPLKQLSSIKQEIKIN